MLFFLISFCNTTKSIMDCINIINIECDPTKSLKEIKNNFQKHHSTLLNLIYIEKKVVVVELKEHNLVLKRIVYMHTLSIENTISVSLNHKNIIKTFLSFIQDDNSNNFCWLVMEKLEGDLDDLDQDRKLEDAKIICLNLCYALKYLQINKILHLDVKMPNVGYKSSKSVITKESAKALVELYSDLKRKCYLYKDVIYNKNYFKINNKKTFYEMMTGANELQFIGDEPLEKDYIVYVLFDFSIAIGYSNIPRLNRIYFNYTNPTSIVPNELFFDNEYTLKTDIFGFGVFCIDLLFDNITIPNISTENSNEKNKQIYISFYDEIQKKKTLLSSVICSCIYSDTKYRLDIDELIKILKSKNIEKEFNAIKEQQKKTRKLMIMADR